MRELSLFIYFTVLQFCSFAVMQFCGFEVKKSCSLPSRLLNQQINK
jgi:hypothetical protein